jgi:hypothetical protein
LPPSAGEPQAQLSEWEDEGRRGAGRGLSPLPFHACNVAAHAGVTSLVFFLARQLAAARRRAPAGSRAGNSAGGSSAGWAAELEPSIAALLFALHPVHTEAVAGIVGHAELLCAALSIGAMLCYMAAADGRAKGARAHWRAVATAVALGWAAALAKEIGITIVSG